MRGVNLQHREGDVRVDSGRVAGSLLDSWVSGQMRTRRGYCSAFGCAFFSSAALAHESNAQVLEPSG